MKTILARVGTILALTVLAASVAFAAPQDKGKGKTKSKAPMCSVCHMALSAKKDKAHPTAVKVAGKTMYCCPKCPMGKKSDKKTKM